MAHEFHSLPMLSRREGWSLDTLRDLFRKRSDAAALLVRIGDRRFIHESNIPRVREMLGKTAVGAA